MKPSTRRFEVQLIRKRNQIERTGIRLAKKAITEQYRDFLAKAANLTPSMWKDIVLSEAPIREFFNTFYPMSAPIAMMTRNYMQPKKDAEEDFYLSVFQGKLRNVLETTQYAERIRSITGTTKNRINTVVSDILSNAEIEGWGIDRMAKELRNQLGAQITGNVLSRAKGIAQTEMISASNQASAFAADSTGFEYRKFWSTSHLKGVRDSHMMAEQDSIARGGIRKEERHSNGLLYPGDPAGSAEEVCNCRCTELYEIL